MSQIKKILLGKIAVDSGLIFICDPCYLETELKSADILKALRSKDHVSLKFTLGHEGAGIVSYTLYGDGYYNVYGYFENDNSRPSRIEINFEE